MSEGEATKAASKRNDGDWLNIAERGSVRGMQFMVWLATAFGRNAARSILPFIAFYYVLFHWPARRASRDYLARVHGKPASLGDVYRHVLAFAQVALDRVFIVSGKHQYFEVTRTGSENLERIASEKKGALLMGAHLGSFEAMRVKAVGQNYPLNVVGFFRNAKMINAALHKLNPETNARLISIDNANLDFILNIKERVEHGEMVAILGDRIGPDGRSTSVNFLGKDAPFPTGVFLLASILKCPIYLTFGLYRSPNHYDLFCEPFCEEVVLPRKGREAALNAYAQKFAERLEHYVRLAPDNWFNFFDFWKPRPGSLK